MSDARGPVSAHALAAAGAIAGLAQLIASVALGLSSPDAIGRAAREGPRIYILCVLLVAAGGGLAYALRRRPLVAVACAGGGLGLAVALARLTRFTRHGLAYHGEFILHHFLTVLCAAICVAVPLQWLRDRKLGRLRAVPLVPAALGAAALVVEHVRASELPSPLGQAGVAALLASWPLALIALWPTLGPLRLRVWLLACLAPLATRLALGGVEALAGVPLGLTAVLPILSAVLLASLACMFLLRPQVEPILRLFAAIGAAVMTLGLYRVYLHRFGDLEGDLGGLVRTLFGFDLPYPGTVPEWQLTAVMLGLFVLFSSVSAALISQRDHLRGLGLALMITAGLGLTTPQLTLMLGAGYLLLLDATAGAPHDPTVTAEPPPEPLEAVFQRAAARLGLPEPVALEQASGRVLSLRGERVVTAEGSPPARVAVHLRARDGRRGPAVELTVGVPGRDKPDVELSLDAGGPRVRGNVRRLESVSESLLATLTDFPGHRLRLWPGGAQLEFGNQLARLDAARLGDIIDLLTRAV
ncbi:MAG: hypothetical protein JNL82_20565 [Myxococcales bacterium]|nr:hypothetical protein [Myxococcales bacterium]